MRANPAFLTLLLLSGLVLSAAAQLSREPGAIYLEDFLPEDDFLELEVTGPYPIYYQVDGKRRLGTLRPGTKAIVEAISEKAYRVRAQAEHAQVKGWASPLAFESHDDENFRDTITAMYERQVIVQDLIANNQVALGMTMMEVESSLGKPDAETSSIDQAGRTDTLEFITYDKVAQYVTNYDQFGRPFQDIIYLKVETGKVSIDFNDGVVAAINNTKGPPDFGGKVRIVPPPIFGGGVILR